MYTPTIGSSELCRVPYLGKESAFVLSRKKVAYSQPLKNIAWLIKASAALLGMQPSQHMSIDATPTIEFANVMLVTISRLALLASSTLLPIARLKPSSRSTPSNMQIQHRGILGTYFALVVFGSLRAVTGRSS